MYVCMYVCLLYALNLLLNCYLLDKWMVIGNVKVRHSVT